MNSPLVKVSRDDLEKFLLRQGKEWNVCGGPQGFYQFVHSTPMTTEALMEAIELYGPDDDCVYVFSDEDGPLEILSQVQFGSVPQVSDTDLDAYIVRAVSGKDFLYFSCDHNDASSANVLTLLPAEPESEETSA